MNTHNIQQQQQQQQHFISLTMVKQREKKNLFLTDTPWRIDKEWAESFVGMRMKVRDDYWSGGGIRSKTNFGMVVSILLIDVKVNGVYCLMMY